jgi:hypothetical protein
MSILITGIFKGLYGDYSMSWLTENLGFDSRQEQETFLLSIVFRSAPRLPSQGVCGAGSQWLKRLRRETDNTPLFNADFKNGGAIPSLSHKSLCQDI